MKYSKTRAKTYIKGKRKNNEWKLSSFQIGMGEKKVDPYPSITHPSQYKISRITKRSILECVFESQKTFPRSYKTEGDSKRTPKGTLLVPHPVDKGFFFRFQKSDVITVFEPSIFVI